MEQKSKDNIAGYMQQIIDLHRWWNQQEPEIQEFNNAVEPLYNRIEGADSRAGEKTILEFTPVELDTLMDAVGCAFEYHEWRRLADTNGILIEVIQLIIGDPTIKDGRTRLKKITDIIHPTILNEKTCPNANEKKATEFRWLIGEIPKNIERFVHEDLKNIKQSMKKQETPVSPAEARKILADKYYAGDIGACRQALYRAGIRTRKMTPGDEKRLPSKAPHQSET